MVATFIAVAVANIARVLEAAGFTRNVVQGEVVYDRRHNHETRCIIRVYTSAAITDTEVRGCGEDAIRACLLWEQDGRTSGISKTKRVHRVAGAGVDQAQAEAQILDRMMERARDLYREANTMLAKPRCPKCGAVCYSDSGKCVRQWAHEPRQDRPWRRSRRPYGRRSYAGYTADERHEAICDGIAAARYEDAAYGRD